MEWPGWRAIAMVIGWAIVFALCLASVVAIELLASM
jgi:hypothetical protein